jgi:hypothetical protein
MNCGITQEGISKLKVLRKLDAGDNPNIASVNHLADTLVELVASWNCGITQEGISELKVLRKLNTTNNNKLIQ